MAWWDDILDLLKTEWKAGAAGAPEEPPSIRAAQALLKRTARELAEARARAEAARRRLLRAQARLEELTRTPEQHPQYRDRLTELARVIAHESELVGSFDTHIGNLSAVHDRIAQQLRELDRDLAMSRSASAAAQTTRAVDPARPPAKSARERPAGFQHARDGQLMDELGKLPQRRRRSRDHED